MQTFINVTHRAELSGLNDRIKKILSRNSKALFSKYPVLFAYLYGSYSIGSAKRFKRY
jgi:predicted nucleotidyltransferase